MKLPLTDVEVGDLVQTRKEHPCGSDRWVVTYAASDVKIKCEGCGRVVMMSREAFIKKRRKLISRLNPEEIMLNKMRSDAKWNPTLKPISPRQPHP